MAEEKDEKVEASNPSGGKKRKRKPEKVAPQVEAAETEDDEEDEETKRAKRAAREKWRAKTLERLHELGMPVTDEATVEALMQAYEAEYKVNMLIDRVGRPTKYHPLLCDWAIWLGKRGYSIRQIAVLFDVSHETLYAWGREKPEFSDALTRAREGAQYWWETVGQASLHSKQFQFGLWNKIVSSRFKADYVDQRGLPYDPKAAKEVTERKVLVLDPADMTIEQKEAVLTALEQARQKEEQ